MTECKFQLKRRRFIIFFFVLMPSFNYEVLKSELVISIKFAHVKKVARKSSLGAL